MPDVWIDIVEGQSAESLAYEHGHFVETVWGHPDNAELKSERIDPHILNPGDRLFVPPIRVKQVEGATDRRHRFRRRGVPSRLTIDLRAVLWEGLAGVPYRLELPERTESGTASADGRISIPLLPDEASAKLVVKWRGEEYAIELGMRSLDPITEWKGVQKRLRNLGLYRGEIDGRNSHETIWAVQMFQLRNGLPTSGVVDDATRAKLREVHGC
jgi:N-acetylmuramoyl-L-alanine amidase